MSIYICVNVFLSVYVHTYLYMSICYLENEKEGLKEGGGDLKEEGGRVMELMRQEGREGTMWEKEGILGGDG